MGYPMTYKRVITRSELEGDYEDNREPSEYRIRPWSLVRGDLRRLEEDQRDSLHLSRYAELAGVSKSKVKIILDAFFEGDF